MLRQPSFHVVLRLCDRQVLPVFLYFVARIPVTAVQPYSASVSAAPPMKVPSTICWM